jgi:hypothetical protein
VLASTEKLLAASAFVVAPLAAASMVVVPAGTPIKTVNALKRSGVGVQRLPKA